MNINSEGNRINDMLFENAGGKIKWIALAVFWLGVAASVLIPIVFAIDTRSTVLLLFIPAGLIVSWLSAIFVYGFGSLVESADGINYKMAFLRNNNRAGIDRANDAENDLEDDGDVISGDCWECPNCGNRDQRTLIVCRRTCGYLGTQFWNQGRTAEIKDRVMHL